MRDTPLQLTLREMRTLFSRPQAMIGLAAMGVILGVSGPFQTFDRLLLMPRIAYWLVMTFVTFGVGTFFGTLVLHLLQGLKPPEFLQPVIFGVASGVPVTACVGVINLFVFGEFGAGSIGLLNLLVYCVLISAAVSVIYGYLMDADKEPVQSDSRLMQRLPANMRGQLISLSVTDHYVEVTTARGSTLVLLRLSDAMAEVGPVAGLQIHRSHWVALDGIARVHRAAGKVLVETTTGANLPVSRTYLPALKERGLLI